MYRPPKSPVSFWDDLDISIDRALDVNKNIVLLGDLNETLFNDSLMNLRNVFFINNLENVITEPTRVTQHSSTLIDPILVSNDLHTYNAGCIHVDSSISDHRATFTYIKFEFFCHPCTTKEVWLYNKGDFNRLNELISSECWMFIDSLTVDEACDRFTTTLLRLMSECIPSKEVIIRPNDVLIRPGFTQKLEDI